MAQVSALITLGIGPQGTVPLLLTGGLGIGAQVAVVAQPDGPHGPGWNLFGRDHHPVSKRKRKVEDLEQDLLRALGDAQDADTPQEQAEAVRDIKRVAATALSVARKEQDAQLEAQARQIIDLRRRGLALTEYIDRVSGILRDQESDDMEALQMITRLI